MKQTRKTWLEQLRRLKTTKGRLRAGQFSMEGYRLIERALRAKTSLRVVLVDEALIHDPTSRWQALASNLRKEEVEIVAVPSDAMAEFVGKRTFGSMVAIAEIPTLPPLRELLERPSKQGGVLVLDRVMDHGNLGAMTRTALASDTACLICLGGGDPFHPKAVRTSMGGIFRLPVYRVEDERALLTLLRETGWHSTGAVVQGGDYAENVAFPDKVAVFMGSEAHGLSDWLLEHLDSLCTIPMGGGVDSFSVNAATAVMLYELNRQRRSRPFIG